MAEMKDVCMGEIRVEAEEVGIDLLVKDLCDKLKSLHYSLKAEGEPLQNFKQENYIRKFVF